MMKANLAAAILIGFMVACIFVLRSLTDEQAYDGDNNQRIEDMVALSDSWFEMAIGADGMELKPEKLDGWRRESVRLNDLVHLLMNNSGKKYAVNSLKYAEIELRLGLSDMVLSQRAGSDNAEAYFVRSEQILQTLTGESAQSDLRRLSAILLSHRANNLVAMGQDEMAGLCLKRALDAVQNTTLAGSLGEASIRKSLAAISFHRGDWQKAIEIAEPAEKIVQRLYGEHNMAEERWGHLALWYVAVSTSRLGKNAEQLFGRYMQQYHRELTPSETAAAYREQAASIGEVAVNTFDSSARREAALERALHIARDAEELLELLANETARLQRIVEEQMAARQVPGSMEDANHSGNHADQLEHAAVFGTMAELHAALHQYHQATACMDNALRLVMQAGGNDPNSPLRVRFLRQYAKILEQSKWKGDKSRISLLVAEAARIEQLSQATRQK